MKKAILVLNGAKVSTKEIEYISSMQSVGCYVLCADGGYKHLKGKIKPNLVLGDFDSFDLNIVEKGVNVEVYQVEKDFTDGHICIQKLTDFGYTDIEIFGATRGGRADHFLSNFSLLAYAKSLGVTATIKDKKFDIYYFENDFSLKTRPKKIISIVPFTDSVHIYNSKGLKYRIDDVILNKLHILGISNQATSTEVSAKVDGGGVLVFVQK